MYSGVAMVIPSILHETCIADPLEPGPSDWLYVLIRKSDDWRNKCAYTFTAFFPSRQPQSRDTMVIAVACIFTWSCLADLCAREG